MLYEFLRKKMLENPYKTLKDEEYIITYSELIEESEKLGMTLKYNKYGILCNSELNTVKSLLACLYAGKSAVILSYKYGEKHIENIINSMNISYLIKDNEIIRTSNLYCQNDDDKEIDNVALIMCTSGTTGTAKGAMISEENLMTNIIDIMKYFEIDSSDRILISRPVYHCAVLTGELLISLVKGLDIVFYNNEFNPIKIIHSVSDNLISVFCSTPTVLYHISKMYKKVMQNTTLKTIAISGECMTEIVAKTMREAFPDVKIYNVYGLTEASPRVSYLPYELFDTYPLSVGIPLNSVKMQILNGELLVKSKSVMKGYYNNPSATTETLVDGWLHTGDIAEIDNNNLIYIKGRRDNMIIRAGINIHPQEIECVLRGYKGIDDILVRGIKDKIVGEKLHFDIVSEIKSKKIIMQLCKDVLPVHHIPDSIDFIEAVQKNASGKVMRY